MSQPTLAGAMQPAWSQSLSTQYFVNSVAISDDGTRVVAGTFYHDYSQGPSASPAPDLRAKEPPPASSGISPNGDFGIYCYDGSGNSLWSDVEEMFEGAYWVALSGNGLIAAAAGWYSDGPPAQGLLKIYDATNGTVLLNYTGITTRVSAVALSSDGSVAVAMAGNTVYVFSQQNGVYSPTPAMIPLQSTTAEAIAIHPDGQWLAACDSGGYVYLIVPGQPVAVYNWQIPSQTTIHSVAIAGEANYFVAGADDGNVYVFETTSMIQNPGPVAQYTVSANAIIRWVACSADASLITVVFNLTPAGAVAALGFNGQNVKSLWQQNLAQMPNSTSIDALGQYVTAADGYNGPGDFYLFAAATGTPLGSFGTPDMCWPMFVSTDGSSIAAGSDDGTLYYFTTSSLGA
jgi:WD40 repeat protein